MGSSSRGARGGMGGWVDGFEFERGMGGWVDGF
jgi:hypothetical protein